MRWLFETAVEPRQLSDLMKADARRSRARGRDGVAPQSYAASTTADQLARQSRMLADGSWVFVNYRELLIPKSRSERPRCVSVPAARDRAPLRALNGFLREHVSAARRPSAQATINLTVRSLREGRFNYFVRLDLRSFFSSVRHDSLIPAIEARVPVAAVRELLKRAIQTPTYADGEAASGRTSAIGIPQGLPVSNALAELAMHDFDDRWSDRADLYYTRFVDDLLFLTVEDNHQQVFEEAAGYLSAHGLEPHPFEQGGSKSSYGHLDEGFDFLGYRLSSTRVSVRSSSIHRLKRAIARLFHQYDGAKSLPEDQARAALAKLVWSVNLRITGCVLDSERRGWLRFYSLIDDFALLNELDYFVEAKCRQYGVKAHADFKRFRRAYRVLARAAVDESGYVPNFDNADVAERVVVLRDIFGVERWRLARWDRALIDNEYEVRLRREVASLERDLTPVY